MKYYLAIDIGASSGRHIVGWKDKGEIQTDEVFRFPNGVVEKEVGLCWDIEELVANVKKGIEKALEKYPKIESLSIDTWGVDYVLMKGDKEVLPVYAYRDKRTEQVIDKVHSLIPFSELYRRTGIQFQTFNTIYQLFSDKETGRLDGVTDYLLIPEYLMYKLCNVKAHEYTNATTGGMVSAKTDEIDWEIIEDLGFPRKLFNPLSKPGEKIGEYMGIKLVLCASHDTASAVEGIPMEDNNPYISSGTWSLLGVKTEKAITSEESEKANYSNEGGVGYKRYQKNIMGMWLINELKSELCPDEDFRNIVEMAKKSSFDEIVDANDRIFFAPKSMKEAFDITLKNKPKDIGGYFRSAYLSLANSYKEAILELEKNTGKTYEKIYIVGGGAKNTFLNDLTKEATKKEIIALPIEATALGNLKIQMEANI